MYLNCHTYFSLRYGTIKPKELLTQLSEAGVKKFVLTDINTTSACLDTIRMSQNMEIEAAIGVDFRNGAHQCYVGIAQNNQGYFHLNNHLSDHLHHDKFFDERSPELEHVFIIYPFSKVKNASWIHHLRPNELIGISLQDLPFIRFSNIATQLKNKLVVLHTVTFSSKKQFNAHRLLRAIDTNCLLSKLPISEAGNINHMLCSHDQLKEKYNDFPQIIKNSKNILEKCSIQFEFGVDQPHKNLTTYTASEDEDFKLIKKLCEQGLKYRYPKSDRSILDRIEKELTIIREKKFLSYFLINWDIISYARKKGYFYVGRGSGANSVIAYLLRITDVDPIDLDLYFERFINLYRQNPPDFDIDFSWLDRDDITRYIFERFNHVTLLAVYNTFKHKAMVRELGKVFGLPKHEIDLLSSGKFRLSSLDHISQLVLKYSKLIDGFPNYLSIHSGGILITEKSMRHYTSTFMPPKGYPTTQFDMVIAEDAGLYKFDILSQRGLGKIKDAIEIVRYNRPSEAPIDIHDMKRFKHDEGIKHILRNAEAIGCFYVESPAMRMLLRKLQVDDYLGLVAASSVIRPGVAKSGMMREYILRFRNPERRKDAHPVLLDIMPETYGVMVYQEDVIKVAHYFAGLDLGEADVLRRGMSGKFRSREEFDKAKNAFFTKGHAKGHPAELVAEVWRQVESFAGYAFAKGHSASYAVESYQSLFLKTYYPLEYMVATINNFGGFYHTELYVHEARMQGGEIHPPCVNNSNAETVIYDKSIFLGFALIKALNHQAIETLLKTRTKGGIFTSFHDFTERVNISLEQISLLIRIGAFRFTGLGKKELLWKAHLGIHKRPQDLSLKLPLESDPRSFELPPLYTAELEDAFDEIELLGFPLRNPFSLLKDGVAGHVMSKDLPNALGKNVTAVGYLVTAKNTITANGRVMNFGTFIDEEGEWLDSVHFPPVAERYPFRGRGIYLIYGKVIEEFGCYHIDVEFLKKLSIVTDPRFDDARTTNRINLYSNKRQRQLTS